MMNPLNLDEVKEKFERDGYVRLEQVLSKEELAVLQKETQGLVDRGWENQNPSKHFFHKPDPITGEEVFYRVQFLFPKATIEPNPYLAVLGHPVILQVVVEKLLEGYSFVLSGEAMVFKLPKNGTAVDVHTDGAHPDPNVLPGHTYFNVDIYLDDATLDNCLLASPGSHKLNYTHQQVKDIGFDFPGLIPVPMKAGDVLVHNTRVVHGSHRSEAPRLRRTLYYEFCTTKYVNEHFKVKGFNGIKGRYLDFDAWIADRTKLIQHGIDVRKTCSFAKGEKSFQLKPPAGVDLSLLEKEVDLAPSFGGTHR
jgi:ectoine hydroxylase-related dioxygenase (phytanoyl-CoA dioxygenase family)